jgi:Kef-type K+ transport system membrane component KefB
MTALTLLLVGAALGYAVARWTGLPAVPVLILAGVATTAAVPVEGQFLQDVLILGLTVLVFTAGIALNPARVRNWRRAALQVGLVQFVLLGMVGIGVGLLLDVSLESALYLGLAMSASSTLVVVRLLEQRQQLFEPVGRLVTGVLLLQDLLIILLIPVVSRFADGWGGVGIGVAGTMGLTLLAAFMIRWGAPFAVRRLAFDEESTLLVVMAILFAFMGLAWMLELPLVTGAFLAGVSLSSFPVNMLVRGQLNSLSDFFHALFFTALGAFLTLPVGAEWIRALLLAGAVMLVTPPLVAWLAERSGFSARPALGAGLLLAQTSEFSLVVALLGVSAGQLPDDLLTVIALVTVITMMATPFLATERVSLFMMRIHPSRRNRPDAEPPRDHILLLGCGRNGMSLLELLIISNHRIAVVDDDPALIDHLEDADVMTFRGDISDPAVLERAGAAHARVVISTIRRVDDNLPLLRLRRDGLTLVRAFHAEDADRIRELGGTPVLYSEAAASEVLAWVDDHLQDGSIRGTDAVEETVGSEAGNGSEGAGGR